MIRLFTLLFCMVLLGPAYAAPLTFTYADAMFEDGGTISGSFVFDSSTQLFSDVDVTTTAATTETIGCSDSGDSRHDMMCGGINYTSSDSRNSSFYWVGIDPSSESALAVSLDIYGALDGDVIDLTTSYLWGTVVGGAIFCWGDTAGNVCQANGSISRQFADGSFTVSAVPVPAAVWLFGSGLGLLGWMRRKA